MTDPGDDSDAVPFTAVRRSVVSQPDIEPEEEVPIVARPSVPFVFTRIKFYALVTLMTASIIVAVAFIVAVQLMSIKISSDRHRLPEVPLNDAPSDGHILVLSVADDLPAWVWIAANGTTTN